MQVEQVVRTKLPSEAVVEKVASSEGIEPTQLEVPLYDSIDPDALNSLVEFSDSRPGTDPLRVEFTYCGYDVVVSADGTVDLAGAD